MPRYTIDMSEEFERVLKEMAEKKGVPRSEIIRNAIASYRYLTENASTDKDRKVSITNGEDRVIKDVVLP